MTGAEPTKPTKAPSADGDIMVTIPDEGIAAVADAIKVSREVAVTAIRAALPHLFPAILGQVAQGQADRAAEIVARENAEKWMTSTKGMERSRLKRLADKHKAICLRAEAGKVSYVPFSQVIDETPDKPPESTGFPFGGGGLGGF